MSKKAKWILFIIVTILACALGGLFAVIKMNEYYLELSIKEDTTILEYGVDEIPEITALCKGTIINKEGTPVETTIEGELDFEKVGTYNVKFVAKYKKLELSQERTFIVQDTQAPEIELVYIPDYFTSPVAEYKEEGFTATDNYDGDITDQVKRKEKDGIVTYKVTDSSGNETVVKREIVYKDVVAPEITLEDGDEFIVNVGSEYEEPGFVAMDDVDGDISENVEITGEVDTEKEGNYVLTYKVADSSENTFEITRTVIVKDAKSPTINLKGDSSIQLLVGKKYKEPGFTATDNKDGDLTDKVTVKGKVNTKKVGKYEIKYTVSDSAGNKTKVTRTVFVYKKQSTTETKNPGKKVVYLTFDDGPSKYTAQLLDTLDKYGVKATFFVTDQFPAYRKMIGESSRRGHTIALHTYKHNFADVYKNIDAYYKDLQKIQDIVVDQTGKEATIVRFPGGTSNTVSKKYTPGIMTEITKTLPLYGYYYCDWHVDSGDSGSTRTAKGVAKNVIKGIKSYNVSIVLQHDITSYSVEAVDEILAWGIANGYTFLPMNESTPMIHHRVNN